MSEKHHELEHADDRQANEISANMVENASNTQKADEFFDKNSSKSDNSSSSSLAFNDKDHNEEEIINLDIGTIDAERRKYLLEALQQLKLKDEKAEDSIESENNIPTTKKLTSFQFKPSSKNENRDKKKSSKTKKPLFSLKFFRNDSNHSGHSIVETEISSVELDKIVVDSLPQSFVAKYLGFCQANGVHGQSSVRGPIDELMRRVGKMSPADDLPLVQIDVINKGVGVKLHKKSRMPFNRMYFPIEYVSSCIRDCRFCRVCALVVVNEISDKFVKTEAHCFVCASPLVAHRLYLSLSFAFRQMKDNLEKHKERVFKLNLSGCETTLDATLTASNKNEEDA